MWAWVYFLSPFQVFSFNESSTHTKFPQPIWHWPFSSVHMAVLFLSLECHHPTAVGLVSVLNVNSIQSSQSVSRRTLFPNTAIRPATHCQLANGHSLGQSARQAMQQVSEIPNLQLAGLGKLWMAGETTETFHFTTLCHATSYRHPRVEQSTKWCLLLPFFQERTAIMRVWVNTFPIDGYSPAVSYIYPCDCLWLTDLE